MVVLKFRTSSDLRCRCISFHVTVPIVSRDTDSHEYLNWGLLTNCIIKEDNFSNALHAACYLS